MNARSLLALVLRLGGLLLTWQVLSYVATYGWMVYHSMFQGREGSLSLMPGALLHVALAYLLFFHADRLVRLAGIPDEPLSVPTPADGGDTFRLLLRVAGALVIAMAIPDLVGDGLGRILVTPRRPPALWIDLGAALLKLAIGLYFLRGGDRVVRFAYGDPPPASP